MKEVTDRKKKKSGQKEEKVILWPDIVHRLCPLAEETVDALCEELLRFANDEETIKLSEFSARNRWTYNFLITLGTRHQKIADTLDQARTIIGNRREKFALKGLYNANIVEKTMAIYDPEYREETRRRAQLAQQEQKQIAIQIGHYQIPDTGLKTPEQRQEEKRETKSES